MRRSKDVEPNHGELDKITPGVGISRVVDISASQGHIVPTAMAFHNGNFYVGNLNTFPIVQGSSKVLKITATGQITVLRGNLTTILGLAFDSAGRLYVLENTTGNQFPTPGTGKVIRIELTGNRTLIASGLFLPTAMTLSRWRALRFERQLWSTTEWPWAGFKNNDTVTPTRTVAK